MDLSPGALRRKIMTCQENVNQEYDTNLYECDGCGEKIEKDAYCDSCAAEWDWQEEEDNLYNEDYCNGSESDSDDSYANW
jgi:ribosomal protein L37AE/L43A